MIRWIAAALVAAALAVAAWFGWRAYSERTAAPAPVEQLAAEEDAGDIETIATVEAAPATGGTPMGERVAVLGLLNKRNGESREVTLKPGESIRVGDVVMRLAACERTAPWEPEPLTGAFVQMGVRGADRQWRRVFSGWLFKERPALNVVLHPVYDVWAKSCAMTFPPTGPDTETLSSSGNASSAPQSPAPRAPAPAADAPTTPESAASSNTV